MSRLASLLLALQAAAAPAQPPAPKAPPPPKTDAGAAAAEARTDSLAERIADRRDRRRQPPRRQAVTPELERSAFSDDRARQTLLRARAARMSQDSALRGYDAKTYQRLSVGMGVRRVGQRLFFRTENAARVRWSRDVGVWLEPTGRRNVAPMLKDAQKEMDVEFDEMTPVPYFPGRETLWFPSGDMGVARAEVDEREMLHPLATGAEAYYRYTTGDSVTIRLPDGKAILLRELRITARKPEWRAFVGSFWFDAGSGHLVRAAYRMAADMDIWRVVEEENSSELADARARARTDTSAAAREALRRAEREAEDDVPPWVKGMMNPMRANISAITVEYGLHQGRFWMPRRNVAEGEAQAGFLRVPIKVEETFKYASVNGDEPLPPLPERRVPTRVAVDSALVVAGDDDDEYEEIVNRVEMRVGERQSTDTSLAGRIARTDSLARVAVQRSDSLRTSAAAARLRGDTATARRDSVRARTYAVRADRRRRSADWLRRRAAECAQGDSYVAGVRTRYDGAVRMAVRMPCDTSRLSQSADLPPSAYEKGEQLFGEGDRDELLKALDLGLQPGWAPEKPRLRSGLDLIRYDRVEGLSVGGLASANLGKGYAARLEARIGTADWVPNAELSVARSNGRVSVRAGAYHRLAIANDDWSGPLTFGASVASLLYARDEGFYYRTWGAELAGTRDAFIGGATAGWRLFVEQQRSAGVTPNTQANLLGVFGGTEFIDNIDAIKATSLGAAGDLARGWGLDPDGWRGTTRVRAEAAWLDPKDGDADAYGRGMLEATVSHGLGPLAASVTGAAGASLGTVPVQRAFYVGGLQTVRGQWASPNGENQVGDAFWLGRTELGLNRNTFRPVVFYDLGWAGSRDRFGKGSPISGAGIGASFLDGLVRADLSRGIRPDDRWRFDMSFDARF